MSYLHITNIDTLSALLDRLISENIKLHFFLKDGVDDNIEHQEKVIKEIKYRITKLLLDVYTDNRYNYVSDKRSELPNVWNYSVVVGYDYYKYSKEFWMHSWASVMPYHLNTNSEYSYFETTNDEQWIDYGLGLIFGWRLNKSLGVFMEG